VAEGADAAIFIKGLEKVELLQSVFELAGIRSVKEVKSEYVFDPHGLERENTRCQVDSHDLRDRRTRHLLVVELLSVKS